MGGQGAEFDNCDFDLLSTDGRYQRPMYEAMAIIREEPQPVITCGRQNEQLLFDDLIPQALVSDEDHVLAVRAFDRQLGSLRAPLADEDAKTAVRDMATTFFTNVYLPTPLRAEEAPPLLWLLLPTAAARRDGSWRRMGGWNADTFELVSRSQPRSRRDLAERTSSFR